MNVVDPEKKIKEALEGSPKRNFVESVDVAINLKNMDMKNPNNRIKEEIMLPEGLGVDRKIAVFAKGDVADRAKKAGADVFSDEDIDEIGKNKRDAKKMASRYDFFLADPRFMSQIGKRFGPVLGPRGKMPIPIVNDSAVEDMILRYKKSIRINTKDNLTFHATLGKTTLGPEKLSKNLMTVLDRVNTRLKDESNLRSVYVKTTMGESKKMK